MNREQALRIVEKQLTKKRYEHTLGVVSATVELAKQYGVDVQKAELAAIFHDYAKCMATDEMEKIIRDNHLSADVLTYNKELWHAIVGAYLVEHEVGIKDQDILQAILYHTSGHENMTKLDKIIYVADYIEPGRNFPGVDRARQLAGEDLDKALLFALKNTISFLAEKESLIYPFTFQAYNKIIRTFGG